MFRLNINVLQRLFSLVVGLAFIPFPAAACPDGQYEVCTGLCYCVPNSAILTRVVENTVNPLPDTLNILGAVVQGDVDKLSQSVGGLVIKSSCPSCDVFGQIVMDKKDKTFVEKVVGRGWLLYVGGTDPALVIADAATSIAKKYAIQAPPSNPLQPTLQSARESKTYIADGALCAVVSDKNIVTAAWVNPPVMRDRKTEQNTTFPNVDLVKGDILVVSSSDECPDVPKDQRKVKNIKLTYSYSNTYPGSTTIMKYFFVGNETE